MSTDTIDLIAAGLAAQSRRAWLARAKAAPYTPPAPRARVVSVAELDAAVAEALQRGYSDLEEKRMAKVHVRLVPEPAAPRRTPCVVCGLSLRLALPAHDICAHCAADPPATRQRLEARRASIQRGLDAALAELGAAVDALDARDAARWTTIAAARLATARDGAMLGRTPAETRAWLGRVKAAVLDETSPAVSDALRRAWHADEAAFWATAGAREELRRVEVASAQLEACLAALEGQGAAVVLSASTPDEAYLVAQDGSTCNCPSFTYRKTCKHIMALQKGLPA